MIEISRDCGAGLCIGAMLDVDKLLQALQEVVDVVAHISPGDGGRALDAFDELLRRSQNQIGRSRRIDSQRQIIHRQRYKRALFSCAFVTCRNRRLGVTYATASAACVKSHGVLTPFEQYRERTVSSDDRKVRTEPSEIDTCRNDPWRPRRLWPFSLDPRCVKKLQVLGFRPIIVASAAQRATKQAGRKVNNRQSSVMLDRKPSVRHGDEDDFRDP